MKTVNHGAGYRDSSGWRPAGREHSSSHASVQETRCPVWGGTCRHSRSSQEGRITPTAIHTASSLRSHLRFQCLRSLLGLWGTPLMLAAATKLTGVPKIQQVLYYLQHRDMFALRAVGPSRYNAGRKKSPRAQRFASPPTLV